MSDDIPFMKTCPFCGGNPMPVDEDVGYNGIYGVNYMVRCIQCGSCGTVCKNVKDAVEMWNKRVK